MGKIQEGREVVATIFDMHPDDVTHWHLDKAFALGEGPLPSERICLEVSADASSLRTFLRGWRELFNRVLQPRFLPEGWDVNAGLEDGRFVPSVASTVEWPGDWRCPDCGVHCFGRSSRCRKCGAEKAQASSTSTMEGIYAAASELAGD